MFIGVFRFFYDLLTSSRFEVLSLISLIVESYLHPHKKKKSKKAFSLRASIMYMDQVVHIDETHISDLYCSHFHNVYIDSN